MTGLSGAILRPSAAIGKPGPSSRGLPVTKVGDGRGVLPQECRLRLDLHVPLSKSPATTLRPRAGLRSRSRYASRNPLRPRFCSLQWQDPRTFLICIEEHGSAPLHGGPAPSDLRQSSESERQPGTPVQAMAFRRVNAYGGTRCNNLLKFRERVRSGEESFRRRRRNGDRNGSTVG